MEEFELEVTYNNKQLHLPARLLQYGFSYKLEIDIDGTPVHFEPDEERNWRALVSYEDLQASQSISPGLLEAIASVIDEALK